jgi:hypothetical protein
MNMTSDPESAPKSAPAPAERGRMPSSSAGAAGYWPTIAGTAFALLAAYVLSIGPVSRQFSAMIIPAGTSDIVTCSVPGPFPINKPSRSALELAYSPLCCVCYAIPGGDKMLGGYLNLWGMSAAEGRALPHRRAAPFTLLPANTL